MTEPMTPEREAKIRTHLALRQEAGDLTIGDVYVRDLLAALDSARDALRLAADIIRSNDADHRRVLAERHAAREQVRHVRAELLDAEARLLDARALVNPRAKKQLDDAARRLRALATSLDGESHA